MKQLRRILLIILAAVLVVGLALVVAGLVLGAHPMEIALEIYQALVARIRFDYSGILPNLQATAAPLA